MAATRGEKRKTVAQTFHLMTPEVKGLLEKEETKKTDDSSEGTPKAVKVKRLSNAAMNKVKKMM